MKTEDTSEEDKEKSCNKKKACNIVEKCTRKNNDIDPCFYVIGTRVIIDKAEYYRDSACYDDQNNNETRNSNTKIDTENDSANCNNDKHEKNDYQNISNLTNHDVNSSSGLDSGNSSDLSSEHLSQPTCNIQKSTLVRNNCDIQNMNFEINGGNCNHKDRSLRFSKANTSSMSKCQRNTDDRFNDNNRLCNCPNQREISKTFIYKKDRLSGENNNSRTPAKKSVASNDDGSPRRDSGISSMGPGSPRSPIDSPSPLKVKENLFKTNPCCSSKKSNTGESKKEILLLTIKKSMFNFEMEKLLIKLKRKLYDSKYTNFSSNKEFLQNWTPIEQQTNNKPQQPLKSSMKHKNKYKSSSSTTQDLNIPSYHGKQQKIPYTKSKTVDIILQIRKCLDIINSSADKPLYGYFPNTNIQVHRKTKLQSFSQNNLDKINYEDCHFTEIIEKFSSYKKRKQRRILKNENKNENIDVNTRNTDLLCKLSVQGNVKEILNVMKGNQMDMNKKDKNGYMPLHYALVNNHFRTAILLLESGTNIKEYTNMRIKEYNDIIKLSGEYDGMV